MMLRESHPIANRPPSLHDDAPELSVVICTHNRAAMLDDALESIARMHVPPRLRWELLVVDNASTDHTANVVTAWKDRLPLRYVHEAEPGLSAARNRALRDVQAEWIVFTDDDVRVDGEWLTALAKACRCWPQASYLAGRILPTYEPDRPAWLTPSCEALLAGVVVRFAPDADAGPLSAALPRPMGANLAFRAEALRAIGGFRTDLGRNGVSLIGGEEVAVLAALERADHHGVYVPDAVVHHRTSTDRLSRRFLARYFAAVGVVAVRTGQIRPTGVLGPPRWMFPKLLRTAWASLPFWVLPPRESTLRRMRSYCFYRGVIKELLACTLLRGRSRRRLATEAAAVPLAAPST